MGLKDARVLVIGGGSGIGYAVAEGAAAEGAEVTIATSSADRSKAAAERLGQGAVGKPLDVTDEAAMEAFFATSGPLDHIVFTAGDWGARRRGPQTLADLDLKEAADVFKVRFWGALAVAKHGAKILRPGGSLTLTNGTVAHRPQKGTPVSTAMAGSLEHLTRALAVDLAPLRVNIVCPGLIRTGVWGDLLGDKQDEMLAAMSRRQMVPRPGEPAEAAEAYLFLMKSGFTTGQVIKVEGGSLLHQ
jgi:NAD(P)-dependent dehydrogenase (short-subunit alcohol dehydrogenase family)